MIKFSQIRFFTTLVAAFLVYATSFTAASALDRHVRIINHTGFTIVRFYGSNKGSKSWEEDILGSDVLKDGHSVRVNFRDGSGYCKFDFKAVFDDGDVLIKKNINICKIGKFTYN